MFIFVKRLWKLTYNVHFSSLAFSAFYTNSFIYLRMQIIQFVSALCVDEGEIKFVKYFQYITFLNKGSFGFNK